MFRCFVVNEWQFPNFFLLEEITQALSRLTEPSVSYTLPSLGTVVTKATKKLQIREEEAPIPGDMLSEILLVGVLCISS